jgi:hypothetical protein
MYDIKPIDRKGFIVAVFFALTIGSVQLAYSQANETAIIDRHLSRQAKRYNCEEPKEYRKTLRGDVNGDHTADIIVLYTLEGCDGANNYSQSLAVFLKKGRSIQYATSAVVGGKLNRNVDLVSISGGRINLDTMGYRSKDPACCPSRKGKTKYTFSKGKLREVK